MVSLRLLDKWFGSTHAVAGVSLDLFAGEILGLVGTNGAGKSSLVRILAGVHMPSAGAVVIEDRDVVFEDPLAASAHGIETVHQNIADGVVPGMTVAENLALDALADGTVRSGLRPRRSRLARGSSPGGWSWMSTCQRRWNRCQRASASS